MITRYTHVDGTIHTLLGSTKHETSGLHEWSIDSRQMMHIKLCCPWESQSGSRSNQEGEGVSISHFPEIILARDRMRPRYKVV